ncbi:hypothetical protein D910_09002 [Dendroctonus ponderosae]|uniref:Mitochondrial Rho GTPase n=1 Tax=Dendroctonus ponderosae TaxID=77166 RepID=U4UCK0_DENPD|nr:hypothetical protein D910_09002 [Dendroctonus ponderosae]
MVIKPHLKRTVRILLVGDRGVGKTSLILSLVSEEFPENVPAKAEEITIPADVTPEQVPTNIDFFVLDAVDQAKPPRYSMSSGAGWEQNRPGGGIYEIMEEFSEIETCIECSAKTLKNISEMFYYAQKAVLHPTSPIYSVEKADLTEPCKKALIRIFKICDIDCDGLLNDIELNNFQSRCFNAPLQPQVLDDVKAVLRKNLDDGVSQNGVTLKGFLYLHSLFIQRGRNETTWTVLRKFGYNDNLNMSKDYLYPSIKVSSGCTTELSYRGQQFLTHIFEKYDKDGDKALSPTEYEELFSTCPTPAWPVDVSAMVPTNDKGWITYQGYMCQWALMTLVDLPRTFEYLAYLGYNIYENDTQISAVTVTREKQLDLAKKQSSRNVYQCHVIGPSSSGKSTFCKSFIRNSIDAQSVLSDKSGSPTCTVNTVQVYGQEKIMVLRDINIRNVSDPLLPHEVQCDVACLVYDISHPKSFEYIARIYIKYFADSKIPVLIVACKDDLEEVRQEYLLQPPSFCQKYKILPPQRFSVKGHFRKDVFVKLATMAAFPNFREFGVITTDPTVWWKAGLSLAAVTALGLIVAKVLHTSDKVR